MGNPNTGEIYEGPLRDADDVPLSSEEAKFLKSLPLRSRIDELQRMARESFRDANANPVTLEELEEMLKP